MVVTEASQVSLIVFNKRLLAVFPQKKLALGRASSVTDMLVYTKENTPR